MDTLEEVNDQVPPRFELGSLDSESRVLTITPWNHKTKDYYGGSSGLSPTCFGVFKFDFPGAD